MSSASYTLGELAQRFELELVGDAERRVHGVASLTSADSTQLAFLANPQYRAQLATTGAVAVVLRRADVAAFSGAALVAKTPYVAFSRIAALFESRPAPTPGIHPTAVVAADAEVDHGASIGPLCVVGERARIGAGVELGPHCVVGPDCVIGAQSRLVAHVTLVERVSLGQRVLIHAGAVLGADGFGLAMDAGRWIKVPQLGGVRVGDDCEIGANTTIDRGALDDTILEEDVRLDNQIHIGHNCWIGAHTAMAGCVGIAGSTRIGSYCLIGGAVGVVGHLEIADRVTITGMSMVSHSITEPGAEYSSGLPAQESRVFRKNAARFRQLDELIRRLIRRTQGTVDDE